MEITKDDSIKKSKHKLNNRKNYNLFISLDTKYC